MLKAAPRIAVLGSINMDIVVRCAHLPVPGETIIASSSSEVSGGKGANQAVAAARLGADVSMIGSVGDDANADRLLENLKRENIDVSHVSRCSNCASGFAVVAVEDSGENAIVVVPGANGTLTVDDVRASADVIRASHTLLMQLEIPVESAIAAMLIARESGTRVVLDPAPVPRPFSPKLFNNDLICPNQSEAASILGTNVDSVNAARNAATQLSQRGSRNAIVTLGPQGAVISDGKSTEWIKPFSIDPVDTTAAGDAFAAALVVRWTETTTLIEAVRFACAAGAIAATRRGAQPGLPTLAEVKEFASARGEW